MTPLIENLQTVLQDPQGSMATAYALVQVLVALGTAPAPELAGHHERSVSALLAALNHPASKRQVHVSTASDKWEGRGSLAETLYAALLRITEGLI